MDILFCDLCNESVPQAALGDGTAYYSKGRLVCAECNKAMGGSEPHLHAGPATPVTGIDVAGIPPVPDAMPEGGLETQDGSGGEASPSGGAPSAAEQGAPAAQAASRGGGAGGVLVGLVSLTFAAVGFSMVLDSLDAASDQASEARDELEGELRAARSDQRQQAAALPGLLEAKAAEVRAGELAAREVLRGTIDQLRVDLAAAEERERRTAEDVMRLRDDMGKRETAFREREDGLKTNLSTLEQDIRFFSDRMIELEETLRAVSARGPAAAGAVGALGMPSAGGASGPAPGTPAARPWAGLLPDLDHANAGIRLDAIYALGETGDVDVVPFLIPMLGDVDLFVRMATARMLEDLDARAAVPALIDALEDNQEAVREAAMVALRKITSKSFGFEPVAGAGDRAKRVKAWRDWWKKSGDAFLTR